MVEEEVDMTADLETSTRRPKPRAARATVIGVVIVAAVALCWFVIFPWIENLLPAEF